MELLGQIRGALSPDAVRRASHFIGEEEGRTRRALGQTIPTLMAAAIHYVSTEGGCFSFLCMLHEGRHVAELLSELPSLLSNRNSARAILSVGERAVSKLIGEQTDAVAHAIGEECGIEDAAAIELMQLTTLAMLAVLARKVGNEEITPQQVIGAIREQRRVTARALPPEVAKIIELYANPAEAAGEIAPSNWTLRKLKLFRLFN